MKRASLAAAWAATLVFGSASASIAAANVNISEQHMLGRNDEEAGYRTLLPFTRELTASGVVVESLAASLERDGVPAATTVGALRALAAAIKDGEIAEGDSYHVRYSQDYTVEGTPLGVGRVLWAEVQTAAKGQITVHRFRSRDNLEQFWLDNGQKAAPSALRLPLDAIVISSVFGPRSDPFGRSQTMGRMGKPTAKGGPPNPALTKVAAALAAGSTLPPGLPTSGSVRGGGVTVLHGSTISASPAYAGLAAAAQPKPKPRFAHALGMHAGVDFAAPAGTPVYAAADGVVAIAAPSGGYGNLIRIEHAGTGATMYGHLLAFAVGIDPGTAVARGDLIGFVGSTGRSTGPHLHFELLVGGKRVNPMNNIEFRPASLRGPDLELFNRQVARANELQDRETRLAEYF